MENPDLLTQSYFYDLDSSFIAKRPIKGRVNSKLLVYDQKSDTITHTHFYKLPEFLKPKDLIVFNNSKVFPCRLFVEKPSGGKAEVFLLSLQNDNGIYPAMIKSNGKKRVGDTFAFKELKIEITDKSESGEFLVKFNKSEYDLLDFLKSHATIPIPPYIRDGIADEKDLTDYQTVYAKNLGSVAAPTAGLHFTPELLKDLSQNNIDQAYVNLQVGAGTFKPVSADSILKHKMHFEYFDVEEQELAKINKAKSIIAVGTTSLRVLESIYDNGKFKLDKKKTDIFLHPGVKVNSINGLITNFHLPKSTLLMLVSSLLGREKTLELYENAKENDYRFFSYGDAMLILRDNYDR